MGKVRHVAKPTTGVNQMAKKVETGPPPPKDIEGFSMAKGGPGWKSCPSCSGFVKGPLSKVCPNCKHEFVFKARVPKTGGSQLSFPPVRTGPDLEKVMKFVFLVGGGSFDKAAKALEAVKADPVIDFAISCGGSQEAIDELTAVKGRLTA